MYSCRHIHWLLTTSNKGHLSGVPLGLPLPLSPNCPVKTQWAAIFLLASNSTSLEMQVFLDYLYNKHILSVAVYDVTGAGFSKLCFPPGSKTPPVQGLPGHQPATSEPGWKREEPGSTLFLLNKHFPRVYSFTHFQNKCFCFVGLFFLTSFTSIFGERLCSGFLSHS